MEATSEQVLAILGEYVVKERLLAARLRVAAGAIDELKARVSELEVEKAESEGLQKRPSE